MKISNFISRVIVAIIAIPIIVFITIQGGYYFFIFISLVSFLALLEFYKLIQKKNIYPLVTLGLIFGFLINLVFLYERLKYSILNIFISNNMVIGYPSQLVLILIVFSIFVLLVILIELFRNKGSAILNISTTLFGVFYISLFLGMLIATRELFEWENFTTFIPKGFNEARQSGLVSGLFNSRYWGGIFIICIFATVWICDSAAYFAGKGFGKHKLYERISPKKTWEGAIFGLIFAILSMVIAKYLFLQFISLLHCIIFGLIVGIIGQVGDLCQSLIKRDVGVKDSSSIIPGHGGVFDRFDSIIFISPIIYLYVDLVLFYF